MVVILSIVQIHRVHQVKMATTSEQPQQRPRSRSILSFGSNKSGKGLKSSGSQRKVDLKETTAEKYRNRIHSKADPTLAMSEEEPASVAVGQSSNLESLRSIQHRDQNGNLIVDPDRSNPTRNRWERPLDTIRSFEAAIDGSYARRSYRMNDFSDTLNSYSRRSSYHQGFTGHSPARLPHDHGYHGSRQAPSRPDSYVDTYNGPNGYNRPRFAPRMATEPTPSRSQTPHGVYPVHGYQRSYDTVTSASGTASNSTEQWGNSTDPSSDNSSVERMPPPPKPDLGDAYGFSGFGGAPDLQSSNYSNYLSNGNQHDRQSQSFPNTSGMTAPAIGRSEPIGNELPPGVPPKVPPHGPSPSTMRAPIKLGGPAMLSTTPSVKEEKRKSWFKRFSRG